MEHKPEHLNGKKRECHYLVFVDSVMITKQHCCRNFFQSQGGIRPQQNRSRSLCDRGQRNQNEEVWSWSITLEGERSRTWCLEGILGSVICALVRLLRQTVHMGYLNSMFSHTVSVAKHLAEEKRTRGGGKRSTLWWSHLLFRKSFLLTAWCRERRST